MSTSVQTGEPTEYVSVADFYAGKSVLITGATGFLGKVYVEKLLYSCKNVEKVYVLIRHKKGIDAQQRVQELIDKPLFSRLKAERPQDLKKIIPVFGDISQPNLGISTEDEKMIINKVSVVFHVAATVKFNEQLKVAVDTNVSGTKQILNLCQRMTNIKVFIYVSTAYCHANNKTLEEKPYPTPANLSEVLKFLEQPHHEERQIKAFLKGLPNSYTFSKALAEHYVAENHRNVPTIIIRPSIVSPSIREPLSGWVDNWFGATSMITAIAKGANKVMFGDANNNLDIIPVDYVANLTIVAAAKFNNSSDAVTIYNCCSSSQNPVTLEELFKYTKKAATQSGFNDNAHIGLTFTKSKLLLCVLTFLLETIPAFIADVFLRVKGKQPRYMKIHSRIVVARNLLNYFSSHSWEMKADRARALHASLSADDKHQFYCDPSEINWHEYIAIYLQGIERFLMTSLNK